MTHFKGTGVALVTPFKNGDIDYASYESLIEHVISGRVDYLVPLGSTGEALLLSNDEQKEVLEFVKGVNNKRKPIVAGCFGGTNTQQLVEKLNDFDLTGIDALLSSSPAYVKPSQEGIYQHFMTLEKASPLPIIVYNVPGRTASNMTADTTLRIAESSEKFIGIKEASGDLHQIRNITDRMPSSFFLTSGDDDLTLDIIKHGGSGAISVIANALPRQFTSIVNHALIEEYDQAAHFHDLLHPFHQWLYIEGNPVGIKALTELIEITSSEVRLPLAPLSTKNYQNLQTEFNKLV